jgi:hypothetical protein
MRPVSERASPSSLLVSAFGWGAERRASTSGLRASRFHESGHVHRGLTSRAAPEFRRVSHLEMCPGSDRGRRCIDERLCGDFLLRFERRVLSLSALAPPRQLLDADLCWRLFF